MSSSVFYKFKNSKEPERIVFEGTGISVFELKREIIIACGLSKSLDFDLHLYPEDDPTTVYDDDTTIISRTSTVIAARRPAARGRGSVARYVSGRAPVRAIKKAGPSKPAVATVTPGGATSEQDAEAAFLQEEAQVWDAQKEALSHAKPVYHKKNPVNVPTHEPPPGYVCYRCQKKGHWIQACPTNDDPDFKPVARAKRTTGIPRSFLKTVEKPTDEDDARGVMLNADGEYVQVMADTKTWEKFQEKTKEAKARAANIEAANMEVAERGLICPIGNHIFIYPVKTPCCGKTYCHDCIEPTLVSGDLVCPNCSTAPVLIDDLVTDQEMVKKIRAYDAEKDREKFDKEQQAREEAKAAAKPSSPANNEENISVPLDTDEKAKARETTRSGSKSPQPSNTSIPQSTSNVKSPLTVAANIISSATPGAGGNGSDTDTSMTSKKRKEAPAEIKPPTAPKAMRVQKEQQARQAHDQTSALEKNFIESMEALKNLPKAMPIIPNPAVPMSMAMPTNPMMAMMNPSNMNGMNPMNNMNPMGQMNGYNNMNDHMNGMNGMNGNWNGYNNGGYPNNMSNNNMNGGYGMGYGNNMNGMQGNMGYNNQGWYPAQNQLQQGYNMGYPSQPMQTNVATFPIQQPNQQGAYERTPVNPHRSQNKHRKQRAPDFHYV
ncbi:DWNN-domain-containing protein [Melanomma pulvis-pyrius CBS 109.77]|uniref:DWNN-domain-containing protein n=1 Tax=Melanomma pulvis-pyrius CBS 109.77 TaxID=1314802 RepID=A0A6A6X5Y8_9PLEO|nr:DWNN-domain-containing protein [Melanomma pulvis-pyrius CBS 109.77]